jgi:hypothetical protein
MYKCLDPCAIRVIKLPITTLLSSIYYYELNNSTSQKLAQYVQLQFWEKNSQKFAASEGRLTLSTYLLWPLSLRPSYVTYILHIFACLYNSPFHALYRLSSSIQAFHHLYFSSLNHITTTFLSNFTK